MTYPQFHLVFIVPPLLVLGVGALCGWIRVPRRLQDWAGLGLLVIIALMYTIPWEVMLIEAGVWSYGAGVVVGRLWGIPFSEIAFIVLQTLLTGFWTHHLLESKDGIENPARGRWWIGAAAGAAVGMAGVVLLATGGRLTYAGSILAWASPVLGIQWAFGWRYLWHNRGRVLLGVAVPTVYLWVVDRFAIELGLWSFSVEQTTNLGIAGLPIEEALFFVVTNLLVVQGLVLWRWAMSHRGIRRAITDAELAGSSR